LLSFRVVFEKLGVPDSRPLPTRRTRAVEIDTIAEFSSARSRSGRKRPVRDPWSSGPRAREETIRHGTEQGVLRALAVTGGVITSAGIVLAGTFSVLAVLPLTFLTELGFVVAFGVLLDTFLVRSVLVPSTALTIGDDFWWPSYLSRGRLGAPQPPHEDVREPAGSARSRAE
jgi:MMPL family